MSELLNQTKVSDVKQFSPDLPRRGSLFRDQRTIEEADAVLESASSLRLPEGECGTRRRREDATPARWALTRWKQHRGPEQARPFRGLGDVGDLHVRQPERALRIVLDDAPLDPIADPKRQVPTRGRVQGLRAPAEQARVERTGAREVACAKLEVDERVRSAALHCPVLWTGVALAK